MTGGRRRRRGPVALLLALAVVLAGCGSDGDGSPEDADTAASADVTVMSRNLYLGADLAPLFAATGDNLAATARATYDQLEASDVEARLEVLASEIEDAAPDLVALQEATLWRTQAEGAAAPTDRYDFVALLLGHLDGAYEVAASADGFSGGLPVPGVGIVTMQDRDVILKRRDSDIEVASPQRGAFDAMLTVDIAGAAIDVVRGWASVEATLDGRSFRFLATHLEAFDDDVRDAQQKELLALVGEEPTLLLGDLNSASEGAGNEAYEAALAAGFEDVWTAQDDERAGPTCCYDADLRGGSLDTRIDYVLYAGAFEVVRAEVVGASPSSRTSSGRWASDHAGVVATLRLPER
jgi:endonuclease/exonuclease/phosphatase family metal-dependent hydrolase